MRKPYKWGKVGMSWIVLCCIIILSLGNGKIPVFAGNGEISSNAQLAGGVSDSGPNGDYYAYVPHTPNAPATTYAFETPRTGKFQIEFDVMPLEDEVNGHIAFNTSDYTMSFTANRKINIMLNSNGRFAANDNTATKEPSEKITYKKNEIYHFIVEIDIENRTYSATVDDKILAQDYEFRNTTPIDIVNIGVMGVVALDGSFKVMNISEKLVGLVDNDTIGMDEINNPTIVNGIKIYKVGPTHKFKKVQDIVVKLEPGDIVEVDGDATYPAPIFIDKTFAGTTENPITIKGVPVNGKKPVIKSLNALNLVEIVADNYVFDSFEVVGNLGEVLEKYTGVTYSNIMEQSFGIRREIGNQTVFRGVFHRADNLIIRNCSVHDVRSGILGADEYSGSITVEYCDIYRNGTDSGHHNLYLSADQARYPESIARIQHNYIHDSNTGNGLKTRARRNEIYFNWFENNYHQSLELIGPDPGLEKREDGYIFNNAEAWRKVDPEFGEFAQREDSDVVGNVIIHDKNHLVRIGGDGTSDMSSGTKVGPAYGQTYGRYRFVNNTFIHYENDADVPGDPRRAIRIEFGIESVEMHNNVFYKPVGKPMSIVAENTNVNSINRVNWASGNRQVRGTNNWVQNGSLDVPDETEWVGTIVGDDPGFIDVSQSVKDFNLKPDSVLVGAGIGINETVESWDDWSNILYDFASGIISHKDFETYTGTPIEQRNIDNVFPNPLMSVDYHPVNPKTLETIVRPKKEMIDIGAFGTPAEWVIADDVVISGRVNMQGSNIKDGELGNYKDGSYILGAPDEKRRIEGFMLEFDLAPSDMMIVYRAHVQANNMRPNKKDDDLDNIWEDDETKLWNKEGIFLGQKVGKRRIEGVELKLINKDTGKLYEDYTIQYQTHIHELGWGDEWAKDGEFAGTRDKSQRLEAIRIKILRKQ